MPFAWKLEKNIAKRSITQLANKKTKVPILALELSYKIENKNM